MAGWNKISRKFVLRVRLTEAYLFILCISEGPVITIREFIVGYTYILLLVS